MGSLNKFMIVLSVVCLITIFQGVSSADDTTQAPAPEPSKAFKFATSPQVALLECTADGFGALTANVAKTKAELHLQPGNLHGLRGCVVLGENGHTQCPNVQTPAAIDYNTVVNFLKLAIGGTTVTREFKHSDIANNKYCTIFTAAEVSNMLTNHVSVNDITLTVEVKSFGHASGTVAVSLASVPRIIATAPPTKQLTLEAGSDDAEKYKFHEYICKLPDCYIGVKRMEGVKVDRFVCSPGVGNKGPLCAAGEMTSDKTKYTVTSIHCETAACPATATFEIMTGLVMETSTPKTMEACGSAVTSVAATTKTQKYSAKYIQPVMACAMWSGPVTKCTGDKEENEFRLKLGKDAKAPVLTKPLTHTDIVALSNSACMVFSVADISAKLNVTDVSDLEISLTLVSKTLSGAAKATFSVGLQAFPYQIEKKGEHDLTTFPVSLHNFMCDYPQCQLDIAKADTYDVSFALCTRGDQTKKFPPVCKNSTAEMAVAGAKKENYVLATITCKTACPAKITAKEGQIVPVTTPAAAKTKSSANTFHLLSVALILAVSLAA